MKKFLLLTAGAMAMMLPASANAQGAAERHNAGERAANPDRPQIDAAALQRRGDRGGDSGGQARGGNRGGGNQSAQGNRGGGGGGWTGGNRGGGGGGWTGGNRGGGGGAWTGGNRGGGGNVTPQFQRRDRDGDGIRNRVDRTPYGGGNFQRRGDRDGDGIRNRYDPTPNGGNFQRRGYGDRDRDGIPNRFDRTPNGGRAWSRNWRGDNRYDWRGYRNYNRNAYRLPRYYAPYGWNYGYRRFGVGVILSSLLFNQQYWIDDPWEYRLPEAYGPYRWVRYYNDALLVDIYTGRVVDVEYDVFW